MVTFTNSILGWFTNTLVFSRYTYSFWEKLPKICICLRRKWRDKLFKQHRGSQTHLEKANHTHLKEVHLQFKHFTIKSKPGLLWALTSWVNSIFLSKLLRSLKRSWLISLPWHMTNLLSINLNHNRNYDPWDCWFWKYIWPLGLFKLDLL